MLDIYFRSLKDKIFNPVCVLVPQNLTPLHITAIAFAFGMCSCICSTVDRARLSAVLWLLNRALDCLDGALARHRGQASDRGGFLDLLCDFIVYSLIPIACAESRAGLQGEIFHLWLAVAFVESSFHINNFVLFYVAAVLEKRKAEDAATAAKEESKTNTSSAYSGRRTKELTSVMMRPALIEGVESGIIFTLMLARPTWTEALCWTMTLLVGISICQRVCWLVPAMS